MYHGIQYLPANNRLKVKLNEMIGQDVMQIDLMNITRTMIVPVIVSALLAITIPKLISWGVLYFTGKKKKKGVTRHSLKFIDDASIATSTKYMYPIMFSILLLIVSIFILKKLFTIWMETVRDDTYLIGKRLHNMQTSLSKNGDESDNNPAF